MKITRIHVNQHHIKYNKQWPTFVKNNGAKPVLTVKDYKQNRKGMRAVIGDGVATIVYSPDKPLPCGATVWIETYEDVHVEA